MTQASDYALSPVGRLVMGSPFEAQTTNMQGAPLTTVQGVPRKSYFIAVAFQKGNPETDNLLARMRAAAVAGWPGGQYNAPAFSWKLIDGDGVDAQGRPYNQREGFAGHWVVKFSTGYPPRCYGPDGASVLTDPQSIRRGYFVRVYCSFEGNNNAQKPGIYANYNLVQMIAYGQEIVSGPDGAQVFSASPVTALPPGATMTPPAPAATPAAPGFPGGAPAAPGGMAPPAWLHGQPPR